MQTFYFYPVNEGAGFSETSAELYNSTRRYAPLVALLVIIAGELHIPHTCCDSWHAASVRTIYLKSSFSDRVSKLKRFLFSPNL
jgi:hypothetical protein